MAKKNTVRISLDVSPDIKDLIEQLADEAHTTNSDVIRRGLALMKVAADAKRKNQQLAIASDGDEIVSTIVGVV